MNILFWSHAKSFTIKDMARSLRAVDDSLSIDLVQNRSDRVEQRADGPFREIYDIESFNKWKKIRHFPQFLSCGVSNWTYLIDTCVLGRSPRQAYRIADLLLSGRRMNEVLSGKSYDAVHFSFPFHLGDIIPFFEIDVDCPIIVHFWGSDLFRVESVEKLIAQKKLIDSSQYAVAATPEMEAVMRYKYGIGIREKTKRLRIGSSEDIYDGIDDAKRQQLPEVLQGEKHAVQIGYNASKLNQHIEIVEALGEREISTRPDILFVFPMTYNGGAGYIRAVRSAAKENLRNFVILKNFLPKKSVAALRSRMDIVVNTPVTDALNSAMTEALYAGSAVINGSWLPYQDLRRNGFRYKTVDELSEIPDAVKKVLNKDVTSLRENLAHENRIIREYASWSGVAEDWVSFYKKIVSRSKQ
jgi:glycosyltransferase involved in cell wall biosynthesis